MNSPLVPMVKNPLTGRYVRLDSRVGKGLMKQYEKEQKEQEEKHEKGGKLVRRIKKNSLVEMKPDTEGMETKYQHPQEIEEIARQLELLRQRLKPAPIVPLQN